MRWGHVGHPRGSDAAEEVLAGDLGMSGDDLHDGFVVERRSIGQLHRGRISVVVGETAEGGVSGVGDEPCRADSRKDRPRDQFADPGDR
jgi:hypothetical protein